jgi:DNA-binding MarR family transcriptional regulator
VNANESRRDELARDAYEVMRSLVLDSERRREVSESVGLSFGRLRALRRVVDQPLSMGDLAAQLNVDRPNLTVLVDDLERLGLVERRTHAGDRRVKVVATTPRGATMARRAQEILDRPPSRFDDLSLEDLRALVDVLRKVRDG